ncbi:MAG: hypothetical protein M3547_06355 [Acidobacteriota bacterium]|nr:hypothetical protein [Acidobacteriota bacterium]
MTLSVTPGNAGNATAFDAEELRLMRDVPPADLAFIAAAKRAFGGRVIEVQIPPAAAESSQKEAEIPRENGPAVGSQPTTGGRGGA